MKGIKKLLESAEIIMGDRSVDFKDLKFEKVVIFFYPKDSTSGCTKESQQFTELLPQFKKVKTQVLGLSRDSVKSHIKFIEKYDLGIPLISDSDEEICTAFDVIKEKNMYGKKVLGIERSTFVLSKDLKVIHEWRKVKADGHAQEVLDFIKGL